MKAERKAPKRVWLQLDEYGGLLAWDFAKKKPRPHEFNEAWKWHRYDLHTPKPKPKARGRK